jgi:5-methylcytosine-specific restriction endonuclease McrA
MTKEERRKYNLNRYYTEKEKIIKSLGGECVICKSKNKLEIDHINPNTKLFEVSLLLSYSKDVVKKEVLKCQILCKECHITKTILESGKKIAKGTHGTLSSYRYCKCDSCKKAKHDYMQQYNMPN